jgi:hypothetical protein
LDNHYGQRPPSADFAALSATSQNRMIKMLDVSQREHRTINIIHQVDFDHQSLWHSPKSLL